MSPFAVALAFAAAAVAVMAALARREHLARRSRHSAIFEAVLPLFDRPALSFEDSGLPRLEGHYKGHKLRLDLIPDTMTIRRLPQLWLSVTELAPVALANAGIAALVRPSGADYYSMTERMHEPLAVPSQLPEECLVRGESVASAVTLQKLASAMGHVFSEPKIKEIAATARGLRLVYQIAEGERGNYLLLRQCDFRDAKLNSAVLDELINGLTKLRQALTAQHP